MSSASDGMAAGGMASAAKADDELVRRGALATLLRNRNGRVGAILTSIAVAAGILAFLGLTPYPPAAIAPRSALQAPSLAHLFGTDQFGRDVLSQVMQGTGVSLFIAVIATLIAAGIGATLGIVAGFVRGRVDWTVGRLTDILFAIPGIVLALAIVAALGAGAVNSAIAIGIGYIPIFVRVTRGPVLALGHADFIRAGQVLGFSRARLLGRHVVPNVSGILAVQISLSLAWCVLAEASLSFLGLGPPPPVSSLGQMVQQSAGLAAAAWWTLVFPSLAIVVTIVGFTFLGDGIRDAADTRMRSQ